MRLIPSWTQDYESREWILLAENLKKLVERGKTGPEIAPQDDCTRMTPQGKLLRLKEGTIRHDSTGVSY